MTMFMCSNRNHGLIHLSAETVTGQSYKVNNVNSKSNLVNPKSIISIPSQSWSIPSQSHTESHFNSTLSSTGISFYYSDFIP